MEIIYLDNESIEEDKLVNLSKRNTPPLPPSPPSPPQPQPPLPRKVPEQLENFTNTLEICTWLVERPHILNLANQMLDAKKSTPSVTPTIFDISDNVSIRSSSIGSGGVSDIADNSYVKIDDVRIISYFVILFFFLFFSFLQFNNYRKNFDNFFFFLQFNNYRKNIDRGTKQ